VRGSRQSVNVRLATAIVANMEVYLSYLNELRVDGGPNRLIQCEWVGLQNRFLVGALKARSFIDVAFCQPMVFFTHHSVVKRPMIRTIMDCAEAWLDELKTLSVIGDNPVLPPLEGIAERVLEALPELRPAYDSWWAELGPDLEVAYAVATDSEFRALVCAHLHDAAPHMIATHRRNLDADAAGIQVLQEAPINNDRVETCFAVYDRTLVLGVSTGAGFGVASACLMKAFDTDAAKEKQAEATMRQRHKSGGSGNGSEADKAELLKGWNMMSYFGLPREKRWSIFKDVRRHYQAWCVDEPRLSREAHVKAKVKRLEEAKSKEVQLCQDRALKHAEFAAIALCTSDADLAALRAVYAGDKEYSKALRNQIRVRHHVYGIPSLQLPRIGSGNTAVEVKRLEDGLRSEFGNRLPPKPPGPTPYPERAPQQNPTNRALEMHEQYLTWVNAAWQELAAMTSQLIFRAPRELAQRAVRVRVVPPRDAALSGTTFTEDEVSWKVLSVLWSPEDEVVIVWYYDVDAAVEEEVTEEEMKQYADAFVSEDPSSGPCPPPLERSTVEEIRSWIFADRQRQGASTTEGLECALGP